MPSGPRMWMRMDTAAARIHLAHWGGEAGGPPPLRDDLRLRPMRRKPPRLGAAKVRFMCSSLGTSPSEGAEHAPAAWPA